MLFVAFDEVERNEESTFSSFSKHLTFGFKLIFIVSFGFMLYNCASENGLIFANIPNRTFPNKEVWRLITAPYATIDGLYGLLSIIVSFWWLISLLPSYERKYSTIHLLMEIFMQNLITQLVYCMVVTILIENTYFFETYNDYFFSIGWLPTIIIWIFKFTGECKQEKINFCFLPFTVKNKYLAWIVSLIMIVLTTQKTPLIVAMFLGALQFQLFHRSCIRVPLCLLSLLQKPFLICQRCFPSFVTMHSAKQRLYQLYGVKDSELLAESTQQHENKQDIEMKNQEQIQPKEDIQEGSEDLS